MLSAKSLLRGRKQKIVFLFTKFKLETRKGNMKKKINLNTSPKMIFSMNRWTLNYTNVAASFTFNLPRFLLMNKIFTLLRAFLALWLQPACCELGWSRTGSVNFFPRAWGRLGWREIWDEYNALAGEYYAERSETLLRFNQV